MAAMSVPQQRDALHEGVMEVFKAMGYPIPNMNKSWTIGNLKEHIEEELPPEVEEPILALAITAGIIHAHRIAEAERN